MEKNHHRDSSSSSTSRDTIRSNVLVLVSDDIDALSESEQQTKLSNVLRMLNDDDERVREELSDDFGMELVNSCKSDGAYDRVLTTILKAFLTETTHSHVKKGLTQAACHLIAMHFCHSKTEHELNKAISILNEAVEEGEADRKEVADAFFEVARSPITPQNRGRYIPALRIAWYLLEGDGCGDEKVSNRRNDFADVLGRHIFAMGGGTEPATKEDVNRCTSLLRCLTQAEFDDCFVRPFKFKLRVDSMAAIRTMSEVIHVLNDHEKGSLIDSHLDGETDLVGVGMNQLDSIDDPALNSSAFLFAELVKASPSEATEITTTLLVDELKQITGSTKTISKSKQIAHTIAVFYVLERVAKAVLLLPESNEIPFLLHPIDDTEHNGTDLAINAISSALEKEENSDGGGDEEVILAANAALDSWMTIRQKQSASDHPVAPSMSSSVAAATRANLSELEDLVVAKTAAAQSSGASKPGAMAVNANDSSAVNARRKMSGGSSTALSPTRRKDHLAVSDAHAAASRQLSQSTVNTLVSLEEDVLAKTRAAKESDSAFVAKNEAYSKREKGSSKDEQQLAETNMGWDSFAPYVDTDGQSKDKRPSDKPQSDKPQSDKPQSDKPPSDYTHPPMGMPPSEHGGIDGGGLAVAIPITQSQEYEDPVFAEEYDPNSKQPFYKKRRYVFFAVGLSIVIIIVAIAASLLTTKKVIEPEPEEETPPPTMQPTTYREFAILQQILTISPDALAETTDSFRATDWIINEDELRLEPDDPSLLQRYILALLYFSTNGEYWTLCSFDPLQTNCIYEEQGVNYTDARFLSVESECEWFGVICNPNNNNTVALYLYGNNMTGTLPSEISELTDLSVIWVNENKISGTIPSEFGKMLNVQDIQLHGNLMTGSIPEEIFDISTLLRLNLAINQLKGTISNKIDGLSVIRGVFLFENELTGTFPTQIGNLQFLTDLEFGDNLLSGGFPSEIGKLSRLGVLNAGFNQFTGTIPSELGELERLRVLFLQENSLDGTLPDEIFSLSNLQWLYLQSNFLTGTLSTEIGELVRLTRLYLEDNKFNHTIPSSLGNLTVIENLNLHFNDFVGTMPESVCKLRDLRLQRLFSDCLGGGPVKCDCCTDCCDSEQTCSTV